MTKEIRQSRMAERQPVAIVALALAVIGLYSFPEPARAQELVPGRSDQASPISVPKTKGAFLGYKTAIEIGLQQHPLLKKAQETAMAAQAFTEQTKAKYYPQLDAYAIQTGGTIRPLSGFNIAGAQNKPTSYVELAGFRADQLIYDFGQTSHKVSAERAHQEATEKDVLTNKAQSFCGSSRPISIVFVSNDWWTLRKRRSGSVASSAIRSPCSTNGS